jgi:hypothetical protein
MTAAASGTNALVQMIQTLRVAPRHTEKATGRRYVSVESRTEAGVVYYCNLKACSCPGFFHRGHCVHTMALGLIRDQRRNG